MRALIVDDHPLFRTALKGIVRTLAADAVLDEACTYDDARVLLAAGSYDLVLLDLLMPGGGEPSTLVELVTQAGTAKVVVVSGVEEPEVIARVRQCTVAGFIAKTQPPDRIASAIGLILNGGNVFPSTYDGTRAPPARTIKAPTLTPKQLQVLDLLAKGHSNKEIAGFLDLSPNTVKIHVTEVLRKLGVASRAQAIATVRNRWPAGTLAVPA